MNTKHIEQTLSEELTSELFDIAYTDRAGDLVTFSLSRHYAEASGTEEVKGDFTSYITELPATLKVFVRRLFSAPAKVFGDKSMAQMFGGVREAYDWLKYRVKGSDGIPKKELPAVEDAARLVENLRVLDSRMISVSTNRQDDLDGINYIRLASSSAGELITEVVDDTEGDWTLNKALPYMPNIERLELNCNKVVSVNIQHLNKLHSLLMPNLISITAERYYGYFPYNCPNLKYIYMPNWVSCTGGIRYHLFEDLPSVEIINLPSFTTMNGDCCDIFGGSLPSLRELYLPKLARLLSIGGFDRGDKTGTLMNCPELRKFITGNWAYINYRYGGVNDGTQYTVVPPSVRGGIFKNSPKLIHLEITGSTRDIYLNYWNPTMALRTDTTAEDYEDLREDTAFANNLEQFLYNFKTYIADRIDDRTSTTALKIVVSAAIYSAISEETTYGILDTIAAKNWTVESA